MGVRDVDRGLRYGVPADIEDADDNLPCLGRANVDLVDSVVVGLGVGVEPGVPVDRCAEGILRFGQPANFEATLWVRANRRDAVRSAAEIHFHGLADEDRGIGKGPIGGLVDDGAGDGDMFAENRSDDHS